MDSEKLNQQWHAICTQVMNYPDMDASQVTAFFSRLEPQAMSDSFLMLTADNDFIKSWVEQHYVEPIQRALLDLCGISFTVAVAVDPGQEARKAAAMAATSSPTTPIPAAAPTGAPASPAMPVPASVATPASFPEAVPAVAAGAPSSPLATAPFPTNTYPAPWPGNPPATAPGTPGSPSTPDLSTTSSSPAAPTAAPWGEGGLGGPTAAVPATGAAGMPGAECIAARPAADIGAEDHYRPQQPTGALGAANPCSAYTFSNFVIGSSNRLAYQMAVQVAEQPGRAALNPLFIYGRSGLGKTHLMRAIQNYIGETYPHLRTVFVDADSITNEYAEASAAHDREKSSFKNFKTFYEEADVLFIDDVQKFQGKERTLDIVFQLLNTLTSRGSQVVLSADRAPKSIGLDERYQSRFAAGSPVDIQPPDIETKLGIVKSFTDELCRSEGFGHLTLANDVQLYIAEISGSNIRELKSAITKVAFYQTSMGEQGDVTMEEVRSLLENHFSGGLSRNITVEDIQRAVEEYYKVSHSDLIGPGRSRTIVHPRHIAVYLCRQMLDMPQGDIGKKFNRDHTTVIHSTRTVEKMLADNVDVQSDVERLMKIIRES